MREILFRGKAINRNKGEHRTKYKNGDWVYGLVTRLYDERFESLPAEMANTDGVNGIDVDYKTIGQYTGLTDKNGKKIFEGDILKGCYDEDNPEEYTVVVVFWDNGWRIQQDNRIPDPLEEYDGRICEVIGNIHDNPELLKGGEEND